MWKRLPCAVGVDLDPSAIDAARAHQRAARRKGQVEWVAADVLEAPLEPGFTRLLTNPPWEPSTASTTRTNSCSPICSVAPPNWPLPRPGWALTHEITRMHRVLEEAASGWRLLREHRFFQKGHHPRLFLLERGWSPGLTAPVGRPAARAARRALHGPSPWPPRHGR